MIDCEILWCLAGGASACQFRALVAASQYGGGVGNAAIPTTCNQRHGQVMARTGKHLRLGVAQIEQTDVSGNTVEQSQARSVGWHFL